MRVRATETLYFLIAFILFSYVFLRVVIPYQLADIALLSLLLFLSSTLRYSRKQFLPLTFLGLFVLSLMVSALVNLSVDILDFVRVFSYITLLALLLGLTNYFILNEKNFFSVLNIFLLMTAIYFLFALFAIVLFYTGKDLMIFKSWLYVRGGERARLQGLFDNPNYFSFSVFVVSLISFYLWRAKRASVLFFMVFTITGLATFSRGYAVGLLIFIFLYISLLFSAKLYGNNFKNIRLKSKTIINFFIFSSLIILGFKLISEIASDNELLFRMILHRVQDGGGGAEARFESITNWYVYGSSGIKQIIFGNGTGFFRYYSFANEDAHNSFLRIFGEYGLLSLILFMAILIIFALNNIKFNKFSIYSASSLLSLIVVMFTNDYFLVRDFWLLLFFIYFVTHIPQVAR